jgi:hypothetical protein
LPAKAPVAKSMSAHLMDEPPTSTPTAREEVFNPSAALQVCPACPLTTL